MSTIAIATLQTPWDCKWSRFGRMHASPNGVAEGLWVCVYSNGARRPIQEWDCETCPHWDDEAPQPRVDRRSSGQVSAPSRVVTACPHLNRTEKRIEIGTRVAAFALAVVLAGMGFVILTSPLAIPLTISLWMGAMTSFLFGVWGRFNRRGLRDQSW